MLENQVEETSEAYVGTISTEVMNYGSRNPLLESEPAEARDGLEDFWNAHKALRCLRMAGADKLMRDQDESRFGGITRHAVFGEVGDVKSGEDTGSGTDGRRGA